ncbi:MAG: hypothetical protein WAM14_27540 [Candidatus Nitrosopolaris sp.]
MQKFKLQDDVELYQEELNKLYNILRTIPDKEDNISFADLSNYFDFIVNSEHVKDMQYETLVNDLNERILIKPYHYDFYFRVGSGLSGFTTGYRVGKGSIYRFKTRHDRQKNKEVTWVICRNVKSGRQKSYFPLVLLIFFSLLSKF